MKILVNNSQQTFLNQCFLSADKGSLSCVLIGQNLFCVMFRVFFKLTKFRFAFCHSVTSFHFCKECRVRKYRLSLFLFKAELACIEINVPQTRNPIKSIPAKFFKQCVSLISV